MAAVDRIARGDEPPAVRLEGAMEIIFGAYGQSDPDFSEMLLTGWMRARHDKHHRLALAWQREQLRLSLEEILQAFRRGQERQRSKEPWLAITLQFPPTRWKTWLDGAKFAESECPTGSPKTPRRMGGSIFSHLRKSARV